MLVSMCMQQLHACRRTWMLPGATAGCWSLGCSATVLTCWWPCCPAAQMPAGGCEHCPRWVTSDCPGRRLLAAHCWQLGCCLCKMAGSTAQQIFTRLWPTVKVLEPAVI